MSGLLTVFAVIGIIAIVLWIYWYVMHKIKTQKQSVDDSRVMPPNRYMNEIGLSCPDYWSNTSNDGTYNYCTNSYYIDVEPKGGDECSDITSCYNYDAEKRIQKFKTSDSDFLDKWDTMTDDEKKSNAYVKERCHWAKCCGPPVGGDDNKKHEYSVWLGINDYC